MFEDTITIKKELNKISLDITPDTYHCFNRNGNQEEKNLLLIILNEILDLTDKDYEKIDKIFYPDKKQKNFLHLIMKSIHILNLLIIRKQKS